MGISFYRDEWDSSSHPPQSARLELLLERPYIERPYIQLVRPRSAVLVGEIPERICDCGWLSDRTPPTVVDQNFDRTELVADRRVRRCDLNFYRCVALDRQRDPAGRPDFVRDLAEDSGASGNERDLVTGGEAAGQRRAETGPDAHYRRHSSFAHVEPPRGGSGGARAKSRGSEGRRSSCGPMNELPRSL